MKIHIERIVQTVREKLNEKSTEKGNIWHSILTQLLETVSKERYEIGK